MGKTSTDPDWRQVMLQRTRKGYFFAHMRCKSKKNVFEIERAVQYRSTVKSFAKRGQHEVIGVEFVALLKPTEYLIRGKSRERILCSAPADALMLIAIIPPLRVAWRSIRM